MFPKHNITPNLVTEKKHEKFVSYMRYITNRKSTKELTRSGTKFPNWQILLEISSTLNYLSLLKPYFLLAEIGFSIKKSMLNAQVKSLKENIIVGLRLVDDCLIKCNGYPNVSITKLLLKSAKDSYDKHNIGLE